MDRLNGWAMTEMAMIGLGRMGGNMARRLATMRFPSRGHGDDAAKVPVKMRKGFGGDAARTNR
jgi:6-phosphogluconate dehydrogenase (decarboxylating)